MLELFSICTFILDLRYKNIFSHGTEIATINIFPKSKYTNSNQLLVVNYVYIVEIILYH